MIKIFKDSGVGGPVAPARLLIPIGGAATIYCIGKKDWEILIDTSWVKIHRKITEWEWYKHPPTRDLFIHLLLTVNYNPTRYMGGDIPAGAAVYGRKELSSILGFSEQSVRTALEHLKSTNEVTIKTTNKFSIIQIVKWDEYQSSTNGSTNNQPTTNQQLTTDKEYNKLRKDIELTNVSSIRKKSEKFEKPYDVCEKLWEDFLIIRKIKKAPVTETAIKGILQEAQKLGWTLNQALEKSCMNNWAGFKAQWVINENLKGNQNVQTSVNQLTKSQRADLALDQAARRILEQGTVHLAIAGPTQTEL